jgi:hypothetical protein
MLTTNIVYEAFNQASKIAAAGAVGGAKVEFEISGIEYLFVITLPDLQRAKQESGLPNFEPLSPANYKKWPLQIMYNLPSTDKGTGEVSSNCL